MDADHHNVSKFSSRTDANYVALKGVIQGLVAEILGEGSLSCQRAHVHNAAQTLAQLLGVDDTSGLGKHQGMDGTCLWIRNRDYYATWASPSKDMIRVLWLTGFPGMGKSTLAQATIKSLKGGDGGCQYHFFSFSDQAKQTAAYTLRSIAFQLALENASFSQSLIQLHETSQLRLEEQGFEIIWTRIFEGIIFKTDFRRPLYWVFDGLDESDSAVSLVNHLFKAKPKSPIRMFLTSRPDSLLLNLAQSGREFLTHVPLTPGDTEEDLKLFISTRLQEIPVISQGRNEMTQTLLNKSAGLFVWVKLALSTLEQAWHTEDDIRRALNDMPQGMESLYERMACTIANMKDTSPRNQALALRILSWATCSAEPLTTSQLAAALEPEFSKLQNPEATILHLCRHFVTVSADGRITPIHETANSFLLGTHPAPSTQTAPSLLSASACHANLATVCLTYLSNPQWRRILSGIQDTISPSRQRSRLRFLTTFPFLPYAASHWAYHAAHASPASASSELIPLLRGFLTQHALAWIHACVVVLEDLRIVTRAAGHLKSYLSALRTSPGEIGRDEIRFLERWAVDLIRVAGRFGRNLIEKPSAVYEIVPPLCPRGSAVYETYAGEGKGGLAFRGLSNDAWDDCVARVPVGGEKSVSRVVCAGIYFVCLLSVGGEIVVCYGETGEEDRRMVHGEYVTVIVADGAGELVATAGIDTLRVWDVGKGAEICRVTKPGSEMVMDMAFGVGGGELVVGYDNSMVVAYEVPNGGVMWEFRADDDDGEARSCPRAMVFSPDATKLATSFPGRPVLVWDFATTPGERPNPYVRAGDLVKRDGDAWAPLDAIVWHPDGLSVFILYQDTTIVRFSLTNDKTVEVKTTAAREIIINPAGGLLLTADNAGTLSLWRLPDFRLLHRLPYHGLVRDLAFSPDSKRFYDVRDAICNIWEPDVPLRDEDDDSGDLSMVGSDTGHSGPVISPSANLRSQITAIAYGPTDKYCVCATEDGGVSIYDAADGTMLRQVYNHPNRAAVLRLAWSPSRRYIASSDNYGRVLAKRPKVTERDGKRTSTVLPCLDFQNDETASQLVFHRDERLLLVSFSTSDQVWNLKTKTQIWRHDRPDGSALRLCLSHPTEKDMLLCLSGDSTTLQPWNPASNEPPSKPESEDSSAPSSPTPHVRMSGLSQNGRYLVAEVLPQVDTHTTLSGKTLRLDVVHLGALGDGTESSPITRDTKMLGEMCASVRYFLGCYKDHVVFLDHEYWVCTWPLGSSPVRAVKRHFFLPRDCISPEAMMLATLTGTGSVLFPKDGELAVVSNGLRV